VTPPARRDPCAAPDFLLESNRFRGDLAGRLAATLNKSLKGRGETPTGNCDVSNAGFFVASGGRRRE